jgi:hypothetical protein
MHALSADQNGHGERRSSTAQFNGLYVGDAATRADDALELALQFGKDISEGEVQAVPI